MSEETPQEIAEVRKRFIIEYMKLAPLIFDSTHDVFSMPGVTFSDEKKDAIKGDNDD